jgi:UDP-N-acetylglucosamine 2-epimerase
LNNSLCLVGNSSVGIRECAYLGVPVVNIGSRQNRRDRGENVVDVSYDEDDIVASMHAILEKKPRAASQIYGGGDAGEQIAKLLKELPLQFHKTITY